MFVGGGHKFEAREELTLTEAAGATRFVLHNEVGDVKVLAEPSATEITATAMLIGRGRNQGDADRALEEIEVTLDPSRSNPGAIEARAHAPNSSNRRSYAVEWRVVAPPNVEVEIHNNVGDIEVSGFQGPALVVNDVGDIRAANIARGLKVTCDVGEVDATAGGAISIQTNVGDADVTVLEGGAESVTITTNVGEITLALPPQWAGTLEAETDTGDVEVSLAGMPVNLTKVRDHRAEGTIGSGGPPIVLSADVGDIEIKRAATN